MVGIEVLQDGRTGSCEGTKRNDSNGQHDTDHPPENHGAVIVPAGFVITAQGPNQDQNPAENGNAVKNIIQNQDQVET